MTVPTLDGQFVLRDLLVGPETDFSGPDDGSEFNFFVAPNLVSTPTPRSGGGVAPGWDTVGGRQLQLDGWIDHYTDSSLTMGKLTQLGLAFATSYFDLPLVFMMSGQVWCYFGRPGGAPGFTPAVDVWAYQADFLATDATLYGPEASVTGPFETIDPAGLQSSRSWSAQCGPCVAPVFQFETLTPLGAVEQIAVGFPALTVPSGSTLTVDARGDWGTPTAFLTDASGSRIYLPGDAVDGSSRLARILPAAIHLGVTWQFAATSGASEATFTWRPAF